MKIQNTIVRPGLPPVPVKQNSPVKTSETNTQGSSRVDLGNTQAKVNSETPVDTAKVQKIKDQIADGSFKINPEKIANRLLDDAKILLKK